MAPISAKRGPVLGLIPAKGGSQRLARKNVALLDGKPLLQWTIDAAFASGVLDRLVVSTEDAEIARMAVEMGAEAPFIRPAYLAKDPYGVVDVALHALTVLRDSGEEYASLIIMLPTCPLRSSEDIAGAYKVFVEAQATFLMSVSQCEHTPFTALRLENDHLTPFFPEYVDARAGGLPSAYRPNGAIHILDVKSFEREKSYLAPPLMGYVMPYERSVDVDNAEDLALAEIILKRR
jgi:CMP-N-acetylneuraminic acid synthetase